MTCDLRIKYDEVLKRRAAELFADGHGHTSVARLLDVPRRTVKGWLRIWRAGGTARLTRMGKNTASTAMRRSFRRRGPS